MLARTFAVVIVALGLVAAIVAAQGDRTNGEVRVLRPASTPDASLRAELRRCRDLGPEAAGDPACEAAWVESRDRFLMRDRPAPEER